MTYQHCLIRRAAFLAASAKGLPEYAMIADPLLARPARKC